MKVKITLENKPLTRPGKLIVEEIECDRITRHEQSFPNGPIWAVFHGAKTKTDKTKADLRILESIIVKVEEEEF